VGKTIFERLDRGRPPSAGDQSRFGANELTRELQKLHAWLQHQDKNIVCLRDIYRHGPRCMRDRKRAISAIEILVGNGWLIPDRAHRFDRRVWHIVRAHSVSTMAIATSTAAHPTPLSG
jgi:hypothetical protein